MRDRSAGRRSPAVPGRVALGDTLSPRVVWRSRRSTGSPSRRRRDGGAPSPRVATRHASGGDRDRSSCASEGARSLARARDRATSTLTARHLRAPLAARRVHCSMSSACSFPESHLRCARTLKPLVPRDRAHRERFPRHRRRAPRGRRKRTFFRIRCHRRGLSRLVRDGGGNVAVSVGATQRRARELRVSSPPSPS